MQDFVKWRGPLFNRFLLALVDDSPRIRTLAEYLLGDTLAAKVRFCLFVKRQLQEWISKQARPGAGEYLLGDTFHFRTTSCVRVYDEEIIHSWHHAGAEDKPTALLL